MFSTDNGGIALKINDAKLSAIRSGSTWNTRLSQIEKIKGKIVICTDELCDFKYLRKIFDKRSENIHIVVPDKCEAIARELYASYPKLNFYLASKINCTFVLIEPETVWLSSASFGLTNGTHNFTIGIHNKEAYDYMYRQLSYLYPKRIEEAYPF